MSYNGTVRCSYCYNTGHNRRSCPKLKKYIEENPDSWRAIQAKESKKRASNRRCSWCNETGHNARTCPWRKDIQENGPALIQKVNKLYAALSGQRGVGRGALVKHNGWGGGVRIVTRAGLGQGTPRNQVPNSKMTPSLFNLFQTYGEPRLDTVVTGGEKTVDEWLPSTDHEADEAYIKQMTKLLTEEEADNTEHMYRGWGYSTQKLRVPSHVKYVPPLEVNGKNIEKPTCYATGDEKYINWSGWHNLIDRVIEGIG